jgi:hypothetical protein
MKTFRLSLTLGSVVFLDAERHETKGHMIVFYRDGVQVAQYALTAIKNMEEISEREAKPKQEERGPA